MVIGLHPESGRVRPSSFSRGIKMGCYSTTIPNQVLSVESSTRSKLFACFVRSWKVKDQNKYGGFRLEYVMRQLHLGNRTKSSIIQEASAYFQTQKKTLRGARLQWEYTPVQQFERREYDDKRINYFVVPSTVFKLDLDAMAKLALICCFRLRKAHSCRLNNKKPLVSVIHNFIGVSRISRRSIERIIVRLVDGQYLIKDKEGYWLAHHAAWAEHFAKWKINKEESSMVIHKEVIAQNGIIECVKKMSATTEEILHPTQEMLDEMTPETIATAQRYFQTGSIMPKPKEKEEIIKRLRTRMAQTT